MPNRRAAAADLLRVRRPERVRRPPRRSRACTIDVAAHVDPIANVEQVAQALHAQRHAVIAKHVDREQRRAAGAACARWRRNGRDSARASTCSPRNRSMATKSKRSAHWSRYVEGVAEHDFEPRHGQPARGARGLDDGRVVVHAGHLHVVAPAQVQQPRQRPAAETEDQRARRALRRNHRRPVAAIGQAIFGRNRLHHAVDQERGASAVFADAHLVRHTRETIHTRARNLRSCATHRNTPMAAPRPPTTEPSNRLPWIVLGLGALLILFGVIAFLTTRGRNTTVTIEGTPTAQAVAGPPHPPSRPRWPRRRCPRRNRRPRRSRAHAVPAPTKPAPPTHCPPRPSRKPPPTRARPSPRAHRTASAAADARTGALPPRPRPVRPRPAPSSASRRRRSPTPAASAIRAPTRTPPMARQPARPRSTWSPTARATSSTTSSSCPT